MDAFSLEEIIWNFGGLQVIFIFSGVLFSCQILQTAESYDQEPVKGL